MDVAGLNWAGPIAEAAIFTAGCAVIHAFRGRPDRLTPGLTFVSLFLLVLVVVGGLSTLMPASHAVDAEAYLIASQ